MNNFSNDEKDFLRNTQLLKHLSEEDFKIFLQKSERVTIASGQDLLVEGSESDDFFIIMSGNVSLLKKEGETNIENFLGTLSIGQTVGEMRIIQNRACSLTVRAEGEVIALQTSIAGLRQDQNCYQSILESIGIILNERLFNTNVTISNTIKEKKLKRKQLIFSLLFIIVLILFLAELSFALYYALNPRDFCDAVYSYPAVNQLPKT